MVSNLVLYTFYKYFIRYLLLAIIHAVQLAVHMDKRFQLRTKVANTCANAKSYTWSMMEQVTDNMITASSRTLGLRPSQGIFVDRESRTWLQPSQTDPLLLDISR